MNEIKSTNYLFLTITISLNIILLLLLFSFVSKYLSNLQNENLNTEKISKINQELNDLDEKLSNYNPENIENIKRRFNNNLSVASYIDEINNEAETSAIDIQDVKVLNATESEINIDLQVSGSMTGISFFIKKLEENISLTEIKKIELNSVNGIISTKLNISGYKYNN